MTLQEFQDLAYKAMVKNKLPKDTYFYCQAMIWRRHPSTYEDIKPEYSVCFYTKEHGNISSDGSTPIEAIERGMLKYRTIVTEPNHLVV